MKTKKFKTVVTFPIVPTLSSKKKPRKKKYIKAARKIAKLTLEHFKKDGWDLNYNVLLADVFYEANKEHLETYFLNELRNSGLVIKMGKGIHGVVIGKKDDNKSKRRKSKSSKTLSNK